MYWDKDSAMRAGEKSMDLPASKRFRVGGSGKLGNKNFSVLGRLVYAHDSGQWSEWFIETADGSIQWLSEDEGELFLEKPVELTEPVPDFEELSPGLTININGKPGVVEELGKATCIGGEGQIPFQVEIGEVYPYADGSAPDGSYSFGLEYDREGARPTAFIGKILSVKGSKTEGAGYAQSSKSAETIRCPSCASPYEGPRVESTEMIVCQSCGSTLELGEGEARLLGKNKGQQPEFTFKVGDEIRLESVEYQVMGRMFYVEYDEGEHYPSAEYALYHPEDGYLWLSEEQGHFTISRPEHGAAHFPEIETPKAKVRHNRDTYKFFEAGTVSLRWVDGALPWRAQVGEQTHYRYAINPPEYIEQEITGNEMELFKGRYVSRSEMEEAVRDDLILPTPRGVYSCQPYSRPDWLKGWTWIGSIFLALNLFLLLMSFSLDEGKPVLDETITYDQYKQEHISKPFYIENPNEIVRLIGSAPLRNSWVSLDLALLDEQDRVRTEFYDEASYYYGRDSDGRWTEGSRTLKTYFKIKDPGEYRLLVHGVGGSGYRGPSLKEPVRIRLESGATVSWIFIPIIVIAALIAISGPFHRITFNARRWQTVVEDDDDD
jgi:hypothetical protein